MIWRFTMSARVSKEEEKRIERKATRFVAVTFFVLAAYVLYESLHKLYTREAPEPSLVGIIIAIVSLIIMPALFLAKYRTGKSINSSSLVADSKETLACSFLSLALLIGLGLNYLFGSWWADPVVGLMIVGYLVKEGSSAWKGEE
jgi:divalent metal cation (Fe/Co/Zn/Cd) transporter